jgi:hypothetical protein
VLVAAVEHAARAVGGVEIDDVVAGDVGGAGELVAQGVVEPLLQGVASALLAADAHVGREQPAEGVEVALVEGEGVARDELADLLQRLEPLDAAREVAGHPRAPSKSSRNP